MSLLSAYDYNVTIAFFLGILATVGIVTLFHAAMHCCRWYKERKAESKHPRRFPTQGGVRFY